MVLRSTSGTFTISTPRDLSVLASPVRNAIIEVLLRDGRSSIAGIAARLDRSPESLYHHMQRLRSIGVVRVAERRKATRQVERMYELTVNDFRIDYSNRSAPFRKALKRSARMMLRSARSEVEQAIDAPPLPGGTTPRHLLGRDLVHLSERSLQALHDRLTELHEWLGRVDGRVDDAGDLCVVSLTQVVAVLPSQSPE